MRTLQELYVDELRDLYSTERRLAEVLPVIAKAAQSADLRAALEKDATEASDHARRLERIFEHLKLSPGGGRCRGLEGLLREGQDLILEEAEPSVRDAGLIVIVQKAQHYEIAGYGSACIFARTLNRGVDVGLLEATLDEEKQTDADYSDLAMHAINIAAAAQPTA